MDIIGHLLRPPRGNRNILTVVDHFTKHVEAYALQDQETNCNTNILKRICGSLRMPYIIHTHQGTNFESILFKEICKFVNISKTRTSPYHPQCDGQVKRMNRTIIELLALNVNNPTKNWDLELRLVLMAYRSAVQISTVYTPYFLLYGKKCGFH